MARLTIEQVKAPDFSASSEMLARANQSFNTGIDSAKGILDKYNTGQQAKGDQALVGSLAGLSSEEELANFLQTTDLTQMNISDTMRQNLLGARESILGNNATRQSTVNAAGANSRANADEGRVAAKYADGVAVRDELRGLTPSYITALQEGQTNGYGASGNEREMLAATLQAEAGGEGIGGMVAAGAVIRNRAESGNYGGNSISGVIMKPGQFSAWNGVTGYANGEGAIDMANLNVSEDAYKAADAILAGNYQDPTGGATHYYNPAVATPAWGQGQNPAGGQWTTIGNHVFGNPDGTRVSASGPITSNPTGGNAAAEFADVLRAGTRLTPDQASQLYSGVLAQQAAGQSLIDTAEAKRQNEVVAGAQIFNLQNPNIITGAGLQAAGLNIPGVSNANRLAAGTAAGELANSFAGVLVPALTPDTEVADAMSRTAVSDAAAAQNGPIARSFALAESFDTAEGGAGKALISQFDVPEGSGLDPAYVDRTLQRMAYYAGVTPGQMAATLSQESQGNFEQFNAMLRDTADTETYANTMSIAKRNFGAEAQATMESQRADSSRRTAERASADLQLSTARTRAARAAIGSDARRKADAEVAAIRDTILKGMTPQEREQNLVDYISKTKMGSRLQGLDPQSGEFYTAMAQLEETIKADSSISANEKELLLRDIRG
jgi:hypothetical protein